MLESRRSKSVESSGSVGSSSMVENNADTEIEVEECLCIILFVGLSAGKLRLWGRR
jgi:hypothetical protein